jgi:hypothetical protein
MIAGCQCIYFYSTLNGSNSSARLFYLDQTFFRFQSD